MNRLYAILIAGLAQGAAAQSPVSIIVSFTERRTSPDGFVERVPRTITGHLLGGNRITDQDQRGRRRRSGHLNSSVLASEFQQAPGARRSAEWRVGPNNTLIRRARYGGFSEYITVSLSRANQCRAVVAYRPVPGARSFATRRGVYQIIDAENVSCSISG